ncbi:MAG: glycoside hydrolase family 32 protein [Clostridia bacterium]|nr:glycoside hydrolase family 32 protein [Clostridia bacterium]
MEKLESVLSRARRYEHEQSSQISASDRPLMHLTPLVGWMNDPNGFCYYRGAYHLYYQYHPYHTSWGPMHWGHAYSTDLMHWTYAPCAMAPDTPGDAAGCFSGSALVLPDGRLMLAYTGVQPASTHGQETQAQCIAFGDGTDFVKAENNPVLSTREMDPLYSRVDFRDPKIWSEDGVFYMVAGCRHAQRAGTILLFRSSDALHWTFVRELDASRSELGQMWECPDFFPMEDTLSGKSTQVLLVSPQEMTAKGEFHAGYGTVALLGEYDKGNHTFTRTSVQPVDEGLDFYAPQTVLAPDGRRILIAWMCNWETCQRAPRQHPWFGQMSLPREVEVRGDRLLQRPAREIQALWKDTVSYERVTVHAPESLPGIAGRVLDLQVTLHTGDTACRRFVMHLATDADHYTEVRLSLTHNELVIDRSHDGSSRDIVHTRHVRIARREETISLRVILDKACVELFVGEGEQVLSCLIETPLSAEAITFQADQPLPMDVTCHHLG